MNQDNGTFRIIVGGIFLLVAAFFILSGSDYGDKQPVPNDPDLPPIATAGR